MYIHIHTYIYIYIYINIYIYIYLYLRCSAVCLAFVASFLIRTDSAIAALSTSATLRDCPNAPASSSRIRRSLTSASDARSIAIRTEGPSAAIFILRFELSSSSSSVRVTHALTRLAWAAAASRLVCSSWLQRSSSSRNRSSKLTFASSAVDACHKQLDWGQIYTYVCIYTHIYICIYLLTYIYML